jgi:small subunit ribosomal protein S6
MPFYELFCLARPGLARAARADLMSSLGKKVLESGGIVTDVATHGERRLAYEIRRPGVTFGEVRSRGSFERQFKSSIEMTR